MAVKLYVGKLAFSTTDTSIRTLFEQYGTVLDAQLIIDRQTGRSKGFGFVEMEDKDAADAAIKALDGSEFEGRNIVVNVARPREDRPQQNYGGDSYRR